LTLGLWFTVLACLVISILPTVSPHAWTQDDPGAISVDGTIEHVDCIAREPHVMRTPEIERPRRHLITALDRAGLEPETMGHQSAKLLRVHRQHCRCHQCVRPYPWDWRMQGNSPHGTLRHGAYNVWNE
jgi:hypothetical protein